VVPVESHEPRLIKMPIQLLIADDHEVIHAGLKSILEGVDIRVVGVASNGRDAIKLVRKLRPDVVLLDVRMPGGDGLECLARVKRDFSKSKVVMFSSFDNPTYIARAFALGASGYLLKSACRKDIKAAVKKAATGEPLWSKEEVRRVSGSLTPKRGESVEIPLTKRESEVLKQMALGLTNKEIAQALGISFETVKEHVQHVLQKLSVTDRTQAAVWAVRKNLV
jgi:DNA-binding NarL/FixJ family response regulator